MSFDARAVHECDVQLGTPGAAVGPRWTSVAMVAAAVALAGSAHAQNAATFPARPVRLVVPQPPGGATDIQARLFAAKLSQHFGQQFIVDNRSGGGAAGVVAFSTVARAAPDGYTLLAIVPSFTFSPALYASYPIDPVRDFAPISLATRAPYLLVVNTGSPARTVKELVALAKAQPDKLNFGAGNAGSGTHLVTAWFIAAADIRAIYVPYRSTATAMLDLAAGRLTATIANVLSVGLHVRAGRLHVLGISTARRSRALPDIPTIAEQGVPGYDASTFHGYAAPAGTPAAIVSKLSAEFARTVRSPDLADRISEDGGEPVGSSAAEFRQFIDDEIRVWRKLVRDTGLRVE